jgi:hypothetical protein
MFLFKGGGRLSTKMETTLKNIYTLGNIVVKFCEIFTWQICKQHEKENTGITF